VEPRPEADAVVTSSLSQSFSGEAQTVREARDFVRDHLIDTDVDIDRAVLLTSELATNAVVHAHSGYQVTIRRSPSTIRVELLNDEPGILPVLNEPGDGGRGLQLLDQMAFRWGTESGTDHKLVWFELPDPARPDST
jgi:anti-sigma regulatory factor (Ser/Thr protein kinase)